MWSRAYEEVGERKLNEIDKKFATTLTPSAAA